MRRFICSEMREGKGRMSHATSRATVRIDGTSSYDCFRFLSSAVVGMQEPALWRRSLFTSALDGTFGVDLLE